jgi:hypothetical protein
MHCPSRACRSRHRSRSNTRSTCPTRRRCRAPTKRS